MASNALQYSTEISPLVEIIDPHDLKTKKSNLTSNNEAITDDEPREEIMACSSAKKKAAQRKRIMSSEDEEDDQNTLKNSEESILRARNDSEPILCHKSDAMDDEVNDFGDETMAREHGEEKTVKKKKRTMIPSDDEEDESTPMQFKKFRTERERNARRKLSLDKLMNERDKKQKRPCHAEEGSLEESKVSSLHEIDERCGDKSDCDLLDVDEDSESQDSASSLLGSDERSGDESDLEDFVVNEDSESQDLTTASHYLFNPSKEQMFQLLAENLLRGIVGASQEGNDDYFKKAETYWEKLINTKKESQVGSSRWKDYKKMLKNYLMVIFIPFAEPIQGKCEACLMPRFLTEQVVCYEEPDGEVKQEFQVGCFCAERGSLYHVLHHYKQHLKESCSEKIKKVRREAGTGTPEGIVEKCLDDKRWLESLFSNFQSPLNAADRWAVDGDRRLAMRKYCQSFVNKGYRAYCSHLRNKSFRCIS